MSEDEKAKRLRLVHFWMFGIIVIMFAGVTTAFALVSRGAISMPSGVLLPTLFVMWPVLLIIPVYAIYRWYYLDKQ